jgi:hypothetical protein
MSIGYVCTGITITVIVTGQRPIEGLVPLDYKKKGACHRHISLVQIPILQLVIADANFA